MNTTPTAPADGSGAPGRSAPADGTLSAAKTAIAETAHAAAAKVKTAASTAATRAKEEGGRVASEKKEMAANRIGGYSSALHDSASHLEEKDPNIAWFTHQAAEKLQGIADYMRQTDMESLRTDCARIARRHPAAFFGGLFVAGLILGNTVKASRRRFDEGAHNAEGQEEGPELAEDGAVDFTQAEGVAAGLEQLTSP